MTFETLSTIHFWVVAVALCILSAMMLAPLVIHAAKKIGKQGIIFSALTVAFLYCAATKPTSKFAFESGIRNNGSYTTNSTVYIGWSRTSLIPSDSPVYIEYRKHGQSGEYTLLGESTIGALQWSTNDFANATNFDFNIWYYYIEPSPVHTNGTWQYRTQKTLDNRFALPIGAKIEKE